MEQEGKTPCVLVADDDARVRDLVCEVLEHSGLRVVAASNGEEVLRLVAAHRPVLIVLDVFMPGMDGYTAIARLRGERGSEDVRVIVLTGRDEPLYHTLSAGVGAVAHLTKPVSPRQLVETVHRALGLGARRERPAGGQAPARP